MITQDEFSMAHTLKKQGYSLRKIAELTGLNRRTVTKRLRRRH
jgi:lambda repressor-like predicted transcriptional regulator